MMTPAQIKSAASVILALRKNRLNIGPAGLDNSEGTRLKAPVNQDENRPKGRRKTGRFDGADGRKPNKTYTGGDGRPPARLKRMESGA